MKVAVHVSIATALGCGSILAIFGAELLRSVGCILLMLSIMGILYGVRK